MVFGKNERREHVRLFKAGMEGVGRAFLVEGWLWTEFGRLDPKSRTEQRGSVVESGKGQGTDCVQVQRA